MKKEKNLGITKIIEIPEGINVNINSEITVSGPLGSLRKKFKLKGAKIELQEKKIVLKSGRSGKKEKKIIGTVVAHIKNMFRGVKKKFTYVLQICSVHFPMSVNVSGNKLIIKNFLGERKEREAEILPDTDVKVEGDKIIVSSMNIESAGQTAANMESATKIRSHDRRIFQDGIWFKEKPVIEE